MHDVHDKGQAGHSPPATKTSAQTARDISCYQKCQENGRLRTGEDLHIRALALYEPIRPPQNGPLSTIARAECRLRSRA